MQATVIYAEIEQELEPQMHLCLIADYHKMIGVGVLNEDDRIAWQAFPDVAISSDAMFPNYAIN